MFQWWKKVMDNQKERAASRDYIKHLQSRVATAHRWLSEFDWLLAPMWEFVIGNNIDIDHAREKMRERLAAKLNEESASTEQAKPELSAFDVLMKAVEEERLYNLKRQSGEPYRNQALLELSHWADMKLLLDGAEDRDKGKPWQPTPEIRFQERQERGSIQSVLQQRWIGWLSEANALGSQWRDVGTVKASANWKEENKPTKNVCYDPK